MTVDELLDYVSEKANVDRSQLATDSPLFSSGILDSMSVLELTAFVEKKARIRFSAAEISLENLDSVDRILSFVDSKRAS
jgi:acyl carrier protein/D-alanine--poly(phosphoribitol) ligase subunit 2